MTQNRPDRRARTVALVGLAFQVALTTYLLLLAFWSASPGVQMLSLMSAVGIAIWTLLLLIYQQKVGVQEETFETEQLRKEREAGVVGGAIFDTEDEALLLARRRLRWMYRWLLPIFTVLIVGLLVIVGGYSFWSWGFVDALDSNRWPVTQFSGMLIWFVGGGAFLSFLFSRYAMGMARLPEGRMLRAGASWLMGLTLLSVAVIVTLAAWHFSNTPFPERIAAKVIRGLMLVLAAEIALNFLLDFYRPRTVDEEPRPAFDSRLLGLFSEPGGIARSIAEAINYQFGFEVSSTWFYKLLQRAFIPLIGFAIVVLLAASCLVFVDTNEQAVVERFGRKLEGVLEPGLHVKYPWPIDQAYKVATAKVHEVKIGIDPSEDKKEEKPDELILWTNKHSQEPHLEVLVATPKLADFLRRLNATRPADTETTTQPAIASAPTSRPGDTSASQTVAVSIMRLAVSIQYTIDDAYAWLTQYEEPEDMLKMIANREINRTCANAEVNGLIGAQRGEIEQNIWKAVQAKADEYKLGVKIVFLGLQGVHPPEPTAGDFQDVVGAEQKAMAAKRAADAEYNKRLSEVAGDKQRAEDLAKLIPEVDALRTAKGPSDPEVQRLREQLDKLFEGSAKDSIVPVGGKAAEIRERARAQRWAYENTARAASQAFVQELAAKKAAPQYYQARRSIEALIGAGDSLRKYVVGTNGTMQFNLQDPMSAPIESAVKDQK